jgi:hypothetical protein
MLVSAEHEVRCAMRGDAVDHYEHALVDVVTASAKIQQVLQRVRQR